MSRKLLSVLVFLTVLQFTAAAQKQLCITVDDLPTTSRAYRTPGGQDSLTRRLLAHFTQYKAPAIGFVVGEQLLKNGRTDPHQVRLLRQWLNAGLELGNHTFAHKGFNTISAKEYIQDVRTGDSICRMVLPKRQTHLRYFRHPYLQRGNTEAKRDSLVQFLAEQKVQEAPVSVDNADYLFSAAYDVAVLRGDKVLAASIGTSYVNYMMDCVHYYESQADSLFKRPIAQILLTHANSINSFYMGELLSRLKADGYQFISLAEALKDPAYQTPDTYAKNGGISWLHRWALSQGKRGKFFQGEPEVPVEIERLLKK